MHYKKLLIIIIIISFIYVGCENQNSRKYVEIKDKAISFNERLREIEKEIIDVSNNYSKIIDSEIDDSLLKKIEKKYKMSENGILYNPIYNNTTTGILSGYSIIDSELKKELFKSELITDEFINAYNKYSEIDQIYIINEKGLLRIYPGFNVIKKVIPRLDFSKYKFFYLTNKRHNSDKDLVWINKPYLDPAGRSWVITVYFPAYDDSDNMLGSVGMDLMLSNLKEKYIEKNMFLVNNKGELILIDESIEQIFNLRPIKELVYYENIMANKILDQEYNMINNKDKSVRKLFSQIEKNSGKVFYYKLDKKYMVISEKINTIDSYLVKLKPIN